MKHRPDSAPGSWRSAMARSALVAAAVMLVGASCSSPSPQTGTPPTSQGQPTTLAVSPEASDTATVPVSEVVEATPVVAPVGPDRASASRFAIRVVESTEAMFYAQNTDLADMFDTMFHPDQSGLLVEQMVGELAPVRSALAEAPTLERTWFAVRALSTEVTNYNETAGTATVEVWATRIFSRQAISEPTAAYETHTLDLAWHDGGWRITGWDSLPGPTARLALSEFPNTAVELDRQLDGHRLLHEQGPVS